MWVSFQVILDGILTTQWRDAKTFNLKENNMCSM